MAAVVMGPARVDLSGIRAGDSNRMAVFVTRDGAPVDLTNATVTASARLTSDAPAVAIAAVVTVVDPGAGELLVEWPGAAVAAAIVGTTFRGVWDLELDDGETVVTVVAGTFSAELDVTRP